LKRKTFILAGYAIAAFCVWASFSPYYVESLANLGGITRWPQAGVLYAVYVALYVSCVLLGIFDIARTLNRKTEKDDEARTLTYLLIVLVLGLFAMTNFPPWYGIPVLPWGNLFVFLHVFALGYAMARHNLMKMESIAPRMAVSFIVVGAILNIFTAESAIQVVFRILIFAIVAFFSGMFLSTFRRVEEARAKVQELAKRLADTNWELSRKNEQLRIIDQRKSEFVSIVSHQLRTPVTAIKGYSSLILENAFGEITKPVREAVEKIFISSDRLAGMITDFLNISKIEQGTMTYSFSSVDLGKMLKELVDDFNVAAGKKKIDLSLSIPEQETFLVTADEGKIRQILSNLIDNAIKYTPMGKVHVSIEHSPDRTKVIVKVTDSGIGLSQDDIQHLFGKFARGAHGQKVFTDGSGLGLYVAKKMLEAHKGKIWVDSPGVGKGSTFAIELLAEDLPTQK
jgi:signal transduction histidine kinase